MTVKELKEALVGVPDDYEVVADDGLGMENGSPVDSVVIMEYYNKICMATRFETDDTTVRLSQKARERYETYILRQMYGL